MRTLILVSLTVVTAVGQRLAAQAGTDVLEISMRRTPCLGRCPTYDLTLTRAGEATYNGVSEATRTGHYRASIDAAAFVRLALLLVDGAFFALDTGYRSAVTDMPTTFLCMRTTSVARCIRHEGHAGPRVLSSLEDSVDAVASGLTWAAGAAR